MTSIQNPKSKIQNRKRSFPQPQAASSRLLLEEAQRYLVGGVNSPVRAFRAVGRDPIFVTKGQGALISDASRRTWIDCVMGWGALILGHAHPGVLRAVRRQTASGVHFGLTSPAEAALAKVISEAMPSIEQVRFTPSGTEACMTAIRLARACTGRSKVLTFEGCYHGHSDGLLVKRGSGLATLGLAGSEGVPEAIAQETIVIPYNDLDALKEAFRRFQDEMACVLLEPVAANMGVVAPEADFLPRLRELTRRHGVLLMFDEVVTGFRVAYGGAQTLFGVTPDLTVLGKIIGGGFPVGAIGGPRHLMQRLAPEGKVYHAGTFAGHPVAMAAGLATLQELQRRAPYERLEALAAQLANGIRDAAQRAGVAVEVNHLGSLLTVFFTNQPVRRFQDAQRADPARFARFANGLADHGVLIPPSQFEAMCLSTAHTREQVERIVQAASKVLG